MWLFEGIEVVPSSGDTCNTKSKVMAGVLARTAVNIEMSIVRLPKLVKGVM